jgi:hypothetical protein
MNNMHSNRYHPVVLEIRNVSYQALELKRLFQLAHCQLFLRVQFKIELLSLVAW